MSLSRSPIASRIDGAEARQKIMLCALKLFADQGYAKTSVRQIARAAKANVSAISYYFADKAGLYRTVFSWPGCDVQPDQYAFIAAELPLSEALRLFYVEFLQPLKMGEIMQDVVKLHFREMFEPTGIWEDEIENEIKPHHAALIGLLTRHLELEHEDDELSSLALGCVGMAVHLFVGQDIIREMSPQLIEGDEAIDKMAERYGRYALAMVLAEKERRTVRKGNRT